MTAIGNLGLSQTVTSSKVKSAEKNKTPEIFTFIPGYSEAKERAEEKKEAGERWTSNPLFRTDLNSSLGYTANKDAIEKVREKLKEEGVDPSKRTPTHEITDDQMAQLAEKYDLEFLSMAGMENSEYGNFLLDLAYMNVFTCDEIENEFFGVCEINAYTQAGEIRYADGGRKLYCNSLTNGRFVGWEELQKFAELNYLRIKEPGRTESYYQKMTEDYMARKEERMSVIHDFFDRASQYFDYGLTNAVKPIIEDASEKLKEDFGGSM